MRSTPLTCNQSTGWQSKAVEKESPCRMLHFGSREMLADGARYQELRTNGDELDGGLNAIARSKLRRLGFHSHGEIPPPAVSGICELPNQKIIVTTITEYAA